MRRFYKSRVVHDPSDHAYRVYTKDRLWSKWQFQTTFSYKQCTQDAVLIAATNYAKKLVAQMVVAEFKGDE